MRGIGEMKRLIGLYERKVDTTSGSSVETLELIAHVRAARWDMSAREFAMAGGRQAESKMIYTIRKLISRELNSGVVIMDGDERLEVVEVVANKQRPGFIDLRAQTTRMEGMGYA